ncbi:MAG: hypothetical protein M0Z50_11200 [Planctomycetia bacterium]|nr:hypothetical protein [Planctomycetia bacterium]
MSEAAATGDYTCVVQIAAWAHTVTELVKDAPSQPANAHPSTPPIGAKAVNGKSASGRRPRSFANGYPKFVRQGNHLIRIAWSKKEKREYQHKIPYPALRALTNAMVEIGTDGRVFSTDQFLPIRDADGAEVPSYQAYVGIALMKQTSLIDQHGRQGYSIPRLADFKDAVEAIWQKLPKQ